MITQPYWTKIVVSVGGYRGPQGPSGPPGPQGPKGDPGMENLEDGNSVGAIRGIYTDDTYTMGEFATALGKDTKAEGEASLAIGTDTEATGDNSFSSGIGSRAIGIGSSAEGFLTSAEGDYSHAEGGETVSKGLASHAEGAETQAEGSLSHSEGYLTSASGIVSHAEGVITFAKGIASHSEGGGTSADGIASHAEGSLTVANGDFSHAEGYGTNTNNMEGSHIMGKYGDADDEYSWYLANGIDENNRGLAAKIIGSTGNMFIDGTYGTPAGDYAELFETISGEGIEPGYFITLEGDKIRKAKSGEYILGISSANPGIIGNCNELRWKDKYMLDEWGRVMYEDVIIPAVKNENEEIIIKEYTQTQPILNPKWDNTRQYVSRLDRPEWVAIGLVGRILVRDDGSCTVNGYCTVDNDGIATSSKDGYRVISRKDDNKIVILFK